MRLKQTLFRTTDSGQSMRYATAKVVALAIVVTGGLATFSTPAHAYIDPGTGGMLLQLLLGGFAGAAVIIKLYWYRIKEGFQRIFGGGARPNEPSDRENESGN
jgi:hypothetical protein